MSTRTKKPNNYTSLAEHYQKKYKSHMQVLEHSPLARAREHGISQYDIVALGRQLDQFRAMCRLYEANSSMAQLDQLPKIGLDVITANFGISPLALIAGVQPIQEEIGIVWFEDFIAQNTRGNVTTGDNLISVLQAPDTYPQNYASDTLIDSEFINAGNGAQTYVGVSLGGAAFLVSPIDPQRCKITGSAIFNAGADTVLWPVMVVDPYTSEFSSSQVVNGNMYSIYGTVDFNAGTVDLQFSADPSGQTTMTATFGVSEEAAADIVSAQLQMQSKVVNARFFALKSTFGLFQQFVAQQRWGMNIQDEMTKKLVQSINNEVINIIIQNIFNVLPAGNTNTWKREPGTGVDYLSHKLTLPDALTDTSKLITRAAGRGHANVWMAGLNACAVLECLPGFTKTFDDMTFGPHVYGTYRGSTVVRVPNGLIPGTTIDNIGNAVPFDDQIIGIYKGPTPFEAAVVWCPYMPLTVTDVLISGTNPLQYQKAVAMSGAIDTMIPNFLCQLTIDQTGFDYGSL